jgi:Domain of unknown function (DUF4167)
LRKRSANGHDQPSGSESAQITSRPSQQKREGKMSNIPNKRRPTGESRRFTPDNQNSHFSAGSRHNSTTGDWQRNYNRYCELARSPASGDAVAREQYWQYAEHFYRLMNGSATL